MGHPLSEFDTSNIMIKYVGIMSSPSCGSYFDINEKFSRFPFNVKLINIPKGRKSQPISVNKSIFKKNEKLIKKEFGKQFMK